MAKQQPKPDAAPAPTEAPRPGLLIKVRAAAAKLLGASKRVKFAVAIVILLVAAHVIALVFWIPRLVTSPVKPQVSLAQALAALDRNSLPEARHIVSLLQQANLLEPRDRGGAAFVSGAVTIADAEFLPESERAKAYHSAAQILEEARTRGFPEGRHAQGLFLLGKSLCLSGNYTAARTSLEEAIRADSKLNREVFSLLAQAYSAGADIDLKKARQYSDRYLAEPALTSSERQEGLLQSARILNRLNDPTGCRAALAQIPSMSPSYPAAVELGAELLMQEAHSLSVAPMVGNAQREEAQTKYRQAIDRFQIVIKRGESTPAIAARSMYQVGICRWKCDEVDAALEQFERLLVEIPRSDEAVAAAYQIADLLQRQGRFEETIAMYRRVMQAMGNLETFQNPYFTLDELRQRMLGTYGEYLRGSQMTTAQQLAQLLHPLFPRERELELSAELLRAASKSYLSKIESASPDQAKLLAAKSRLELRQAGQAFAKLAELHSSTRAYSDDLWNASECFLQGRDYKRAAQSLGLYLKNELRRRRASALLMLGEAQLTLGETEKALASLQECVAVYSNDPASFQARLLMAKAFSEKGEAVKAEPLLRENLDGGNLTPRSSEWRDSLFALGSLLQADGRYPEGIQKLEEAVARYPEAPAAIEARYLIAQSYSRLAQQAQQKIAEDAIESARIAHTRQMHQNLNAAIQQYEQVQAILGRREEHLNPQPLDAAIRRNCYFALGAALFDLARYEEAIRVYSTVTNLYRNEPEVLEAFMQIAACYRRLNRAQEARGTIAQAKAALDRISKDANFTLTTNFSREEWSQVLDRTAAL